MDNTENLRKSIIDDLSYGDSKMIFSKSGKEIKEKVEQYIEYERSHKSELKNKLLLEAAELSKKGFLPDTTPDLHRIPDYKATWIPKKFSHDQIYSGERYVGNEMTMGEVETKQASSEERNEMREYNRYVSNYIDHCVHEIQLTTLKENLKDNQNYKLTLDQLSKLGF